MTRIEDLFGTGCFDCDQTGHVCADDDPVAAHLGKIRPWSGISDRVDACDHGGGVPCPGCSPPLPAAWTPQPHEQAETP